MRIHQYQQIIIPINSFIRKLTPVERVFLSVLEVALIIGLVSSSVLYA